MQNVLDKIIFNDHQCNMPKGMHFKMKCPFLDIDSPFSKRKCTVCKMHHKFLKNIFMNK